MIIQGSLHCICSYYRLCNAAYTAAQGVASLTWSLCHQPCVLWYLTSHTLHFYDIFITSINFWYPTLVWHMYKPPSTLCAVRSDFSYPTRIWYVNNFLTSYYGLDFPDVEWSLVCHQPCVLSHLTSVYSHILQAGRGLISVLCPIRLLYVIISCRPVVVYHHYFVQFYFCM